MRPLQDMWRRGLSRLVVVVSVGTATWARIEAQVVVRGGVADSAGAGLSGVEVLVNGRNAATTDALGRFRLSLPLGVFELRFRGIGLVSTTRRLTIIDTSAVQIDIILVPAAQRLADVSVSAGRSPGGLGSEAGWGGVVLSEDLLRRSEHRRLSDLIRAHAPGVRMVRQGRKSVALGRRGVSACPMAIWVDGMRVYAPNAIEAGEFTKTTGAFARDTAMNPTPDLDHWSVADLATVLIYAGGVQVPSQWQVTGASCGTIVLRTRRR